MDNYGQYFYEYVDRGSRMNLFFSRSITKRLGTSKKPCQSDRVRLFNHTYSYEQVVCKWLTACHEYYHSKCNCLCPLEFFPPSTSHPIMLTSGQLISTASNGQMAVNHHCPQPCRGVKHPMTLINSAQCPPACHSTAFSKVNVMVDQLPDSSLLGLALIQSEGMTEMTEEELYSLAKLFGEIGGISSFCFGFSCVLCFELFELAYWFRVNHRKSRTCETANLSWWRFKRRWWWFTGHSPPSPSPRDQSRIDTRREGSNKHNLRSSVSLVLTTNSANNCTTSDQVGDRSRSDTATDDHLQVNASRPFSLHTLEVIADLNGSLFSVPSQVIGAQKKLDES